MQSLLLDSVEWLLPAMLAMLPEDPIVEAPSPSLLLRRLCLELAPSLKSLFSSLEGELARDLLDGLLLL